MGNGCSCGKNSIHPRVESIPKGSKKEREGQKNDYKSTETKQATFKEGVKNSVDIDPCEEEDEETAIQKVKEYKFLPPIPKRKSVASPHISYKPNRVWGGSVNSYLDTTNRKSVIDEDMITGG